MIHDWLKAVPIGATPVRMITIVEHNGAVECASLWQPNKTPRHAPHGPKSPSIDACKPTNEPVIRDALSRVDQQRRAVTIGKREGRNARGQNMPLFPTPEGAVLRKEWTDCKGYGTLGPLTATGVPAYT